MDRAWASNVGSIAPLLPSSFNIGYPQEGDPAQGTEATMPGLWWFHSMTEEVRNVIKLAGLTPNPAALNQLGAAIVQLANAAAVGGATSLLALDPTAAAQLTAASASATVALAQAASAVTAAAVASAAATAANTAAAHAQSTADTALASIGIISSDNVLAPVEKPSILLDYTNVTGEKAGIDSQATAYGITTEKTAYDNAVTALTAYLATLTAPYSWNDITGTTTIVGTTFRANWAAVYSTRQALLNKISAVSLTNYNSAASTAATAITNAATAQTTANAANAAAAAAVTTANAALQGITDIGNDNILSPGEKPVVKLDYDNILNEQAGIDTQAAGFSIPTATYDGAISALTAYLGTLSGWNVIPGSNVAIVGTTFRSMFEAVYSAKQNLLNTMAAVAATLANWSQITGTGKPANWASADILLQTRGNCQLIGGNSVQKVGGAAAWDSDAYSLESFSGGSFVGFIPAQTNRALFFGLNTDPTTDQSYTSIDYAIYCDNAGNISAWASGALIQTLGAYAANDLLTISYDGAHYVWARNGASLYTIAAPAGIRYYLDSSFSDPGGIVNGIRFGPLSPVTGIGTPQILPGAVTAGGSSSFGFTNVVGPVGASSSLSGYFDGQLVTTVGGNLHVDVTSVFKLIFSTSAARVFYAGAAIELWGGSGGHFTVALESTQAGATSPLAPGMDSISLNLSGLAVGLPADTYRVRLNCSIYSFDAATGASSITMTQLRLAATVATQESKV